jgi:hypothetical protein
VERAGSSDRGSYLSRESMSVRRAGDDSPPRHAATTSASESNRLIVAG